MGKLSYAYKWGSGIAIVLNGAALSVGVAAYKGNDAVWEDVLMPAARLCMDGENAHRMAVIAAKYRAVPRRKYLNKEILHSSVWGLEFPSPVGMAAGFDKDGEAVDGLFLMGCGFVEVGTITPLPQPGNPKPRVFRLLEDKAVINRYGLNSAGHDAVYGRLKFRAEGKKEPGILGVNLGKNKTSDDALSDYVKGVEKFSDIADYLVINVSCPNVVGFSNMQGKQYLQELVQGVVAARDKISDARRVPLLVKIAPDLSEQGKQDVATIVANPNSGIDGLIVSNTTVSRPSTLGSVHKGEQGGLSGAPLKDLATQSISDMYALTGGSIPIIGVGGVDSGQDAYDKIRAGASLIEVYTSMVYRGPTAVAKITSELATLLKKDGFKNVSEAVGAEHR